MDQPDTYATALAYLREHRVMSLATWGDKGVWAAAVFYVNEGFNLYFLSAGHTRHVQNMKAHPEVAATIQEDYQDWQDIQGIQLEGRVQLLTDINRQTAVTRYQQKFPFLTQADAQLQAALTRVNWYCLSPQKLYFIDNSKGLGHREALSLPVTDY